MAANKDQYRVSKVTSARKNIEQAAFQAGQEIYLQKLKSGYEEKIRVSTHICIMSSDRQSVDLC